MKTDYELIEHTADIFIKAYGRTLAEAYAAVAEAMFLQMVDETEIAEIEEVVLTIDGLDSEQLLVTFLSELIVVHEIRNLVLGRIEVQLISDHQLTARCWGEKFDEQKHRHGLMFKAVSYYLMEIAPPSGDSPAYVKVLFDI